MNKIFTALALVSGLAIPAAAVYADDAAPAPAPAADAAAAPAAPAAPTPPWTITTNVFGVSDYYFRGITQTWHKPAIQGGADFVHSSGWYLGVWGSNVTNNTYPGGSGLEFDYYGGYNGKFNDDWGWTAGGHGYYYPGADFNKAAGCAAGGCPSDSFNTFEGNIGASYKFMSVKYSRMFTNWFGLDKKIGYTDDTKGTGYLEFDLGYEFVPTYTLNFHAAHTHVNAKLITPTGNIDPSYSDYLIGVTKAFDGGWSAQLAFAKSTYANDAFYKPTFSFANGDKLSDPGSGRVILSVGRTF